MFNLYINYQTILSLIKSSIFIYRYSILFLLIPTVAFSQSITPEFSKEAGFYDSQIQVQISVDHPDAMIFYTTDGSVPTLTSDQYTEPLVFQSREGDPNIYSEFSTNTLGEGHPYREN